MTDFFALLRQERRPWIDGEELKARYLEVSKEIHPDRSAANANARKKASDEHALLNEAFQILKDSRKRIAHLIELERGRHPKGIESAPDGMMDLFMEVAAVIQRLDAALRERQAAVSPLLKAGMASKGLALADEASIFLDRLTRLRAQEEDALKALDAVVSAEGSVEQALYSLETLYRRMGFLDRWISQVSERKLRLSMPME